MIRRIRLILWAMLGRPIIYGCKFKNLELAENNRKLYMAKCTVLSAPAQQSS